MAKSTLPTNFKDDILNSSMGGKRRYKLINNSDGTVSLEDASAYDQVGSEYGASQVNAANAAVNASADAGKIVDDIDNIGAITQKGYIAGALALKQVNDSLKDAKSSSGLDYSKAVMLLDDEKTSGAWKYTAEQRGVLMLCGIFATTAIMIYKINDLIEGVLCDKGSSSNDRGLCSATILLDVGDFVSVDDGQLSQNAAIYHRFTFFVPFK